MPSGSESDTLKKPTPLQPLRAVTHFIYTPKRESPWKKIFEYKMDEAFQCRPMSFLHKQRWQYSMTHSFLGSNVPQCYPKLYPKPVSGISFSNSSTNEPSALFFFAAAAASCFWHSWDRVEDREVIGHVELQPAQKNSVARFPQRVDEESDWKSMEAQSFTGNNNGATSPAGLQHNLHQLVITRGQILLLIEWLMWFHSLTCSTGKYLTLTC